MILNFTFGVFEIQYLNATALTTKIKVFFKRHGDWTKQSLITSQLAESANLIANEFSFVTQTSATFDIRL